MFRVNSYCQYFIKQNGRNSKWNELAYFIQTAWFRDEKITYFVEKNSDVVTIFSTCLVEHGIVGFSETFSGWKAQSSKVNDTSKKQR